MTQICKVKHQRLKGAELAADMHERLAVRIDLKAARRQARREDRLARRAARKQQR